jgi:hypothetical protein
MSVRPSPTRLVHAAKSGAAVALRRCSLTSRSAFFLDQFASVQALAELANLLLGGHRIECDAREPHPEFANLLPRANPLTPLCLRPLPASSAHCNPLCPILYREASIPPSPTHSDPSSAPPSSTQWPHPASLHYASLPHRRRGAPLPSEDEHEQQKTLRRSPPSRICPSSPLPLCRLAQPCSKHPLEKGDTFPSCSLGSFATKPDAMAALYLDAPPSPRWSHLCIHYCALGLGPSPSHGMIGQGGGHIGPSPSPSLIVCSL